MSDKRKKTNERVNEALRQGTWTTPRLTVERAVEQSPEAKMMNAFVLRAPGSLPVKGDGR